MQFEMGCNEDGKNKSNNTHTANEMAAQDSQDSFHEHLGGRGLSSLEPFDVMHVEAKVIRDAPFTRANGRFLFSGPLSLQDLLNDFVLREVLDRREVLLVVFA